ncbi:MAG TPA: hypothetical protein VNN20_13245 [Thermodesulfobacteriota bacterium]|nr:hypothetical protein [Thermodesulfobacteriota bacterium]
MHTVTSTSSTENVKYVLNLGLSRQESVIKPIEEYCYYFLKQGSNVLIESEAFSATTLSYMDWIGSIMYVFTSEGSANVTSQIEEALNQLHQDWIEIPKPAEVRDYLIRYPDLASILPFVCKVARERFGVYPELSLEVYCDPEIEDEYLTLYVRQENYDEDILSAIEDISAQYESILMGKSGWFLVTTDFRSPK